MKKFEVIDNGAQEYEIEADGFVFDGLGILKFVHEGEDVAAFSNGSWLSVREITYNSDSGDEREGT